MSGSGKRDKGKREPQKKAALSLKEKRRLKHEKKNAQAHTGGGGGLLTQ